MMRLPSSVRRPARISSPRRLKQIVLLMLSAALCAGVLIIPPPSTFAGDKARSRAEKAVREGDYELAEKLYREMLTKDARDKEARLGLSFTLYKKRNLRDAFDHIARVLSEDPLSARAHALLGTVILASGDFRRSIEEFRTALSLRSDDARAIAGLALVDFYENRLDESMQGLRRASFIDPYEPDYVYDLGQVAARIERYKEAADAYERFLMVAPKMDLDRRARIRGLIDFLRYLGDQGALYAPGGDNRTTLSFEPNNPRPVLRVRLNGSKETLRFVLDTGSGMSVLSEETAQRLGIKAVARGGLARAVGGGGRFEIVYGFLSSMDLGDVRVSNVPVYIRKFYTSGKPVDGYIGLSVIAKYITTIDYASRNFTLARQRGADNSPSPPSIVFQQPGQSPASYEIPMRTTSSGFLSGEVHLEGIERPLNFIIDTGAEISVLSELLYKSEDIADFARNERMTVYGAAGVAENVTTLLLPRVSLGAHVREGIRAVVLDLEPVNETAGFDQTGILGANFLQHYRVTFDFGRSVLRLEPLRNDTQKKEATPAATDVPEQP
ncbi:MAG: aspartyl protease family protein [Acidobacteria bacterium]|nr:aspartyl protease family protein [Acidobacteriota bacterium]